MDKQAISLVVSGINARLGELIQKHAALSHEIEQLEAEKQRLLNLMEDEP